MWNFVAAIIATLLHNRRIAITDVCSSSSSSSSSIDRPRSRTHEWRMSIDRNGYHTYRFIHRRLIILSITVVYSLPLPLQPPWPLPQWLLHAPSSSSTIGNPLVISIYTFSHRALIVKIISLVQYIIIVINNLRLFLATRYINNSFVFLPIVVNQWTDIEWRYFISRFSVQRKKERLWLKLLYL